MPCTSLRLALAGAPLKHQACDPVGDCTRSSRNQKPRVSSGLESLSCLALIFGCCDTQELSAGCREAIAPRPHASSASLEELASLLVSIPDRAAASHLSALQPSAFARQVNEFALTYQPDADDAETQKSHG